MHNTITVWFLRAKRLWKKVQGCLHRHFHFNFSLKRKDDPDDPLLSLNVKGQIPREVIAFLSVLGALTLLCGIWKLLRKL